MRQEAGKLEGEKVGMKMEGTFSESGMVFGGKTTTYNDVSRQITKINFKEYIKNDEGYFLALIVIKMNYMEK